MEEKRYYAGIDWLRIIAAFGIVGCHLDLARMTDGARWLKEFTDLNVGIFAVVAGFFATHSAAGLSWREYIRRRASRLLLPYAFWSVLYVAIDIVFDTLADKALTFQPTHLSWWMTVIFLGNGAAHLWFLVSLFYTQTFGYPILSYCSRHPSRTRSAILAVAGLTLVGFCPVIGGWAASYPLRLAGFFCVGIALYRERECVAFIRVGWYAALLAIGLILKGFGWHYGYVGESVVILPAVLLAIVAKPKSERLTAVGKYLGSLSFGVYLSHVFFAIGIRQAIQILGIVPQSAAVFAADWVASFLLALVTAAILQWLCRRFTWLRWLSL